tara:strand:+ start:188 stop:751 length:564 start_codon:yes stop_codon:yes gene_type:complete
MSKQNLIIFQLPTLFKILKELDQHLNFNIIEAKNEKDIIDNIQIIDQYLLISKKETNLTDKQFVFDFSPIKIVKLIEKINIFFLKNHFNKQSKIKIYDYTIDLNSREISLNNKKLKLTEKEVNTIIYLSQSNKPVNVDELEKNVWRYLSDLESHTVATHIYRLRKKIFSIFKDDNFIVSRKNGYQIK